jgi:Na+/H+ antiporter NhaD/arsenite permease-like protein
VSGSAAEAAVWAVAGLTTMGIVTRPFGWPEAIWAALGATILVACGLLSFEEAKTAIGKGYDVYLFLIGMMLLSEVARSEGVFDYVADHALGYARRSPARLFALIYAVGTVVTALMSNDATAVVLTPAVFAAARRAREHRSLWRSHPAARELAQELRRSVRSLGARDLRHPALATARTAARRVRRA